MNKLRIGTKIYYVDKLANEIFIVELIDDSSTQQLYNLFNRLNVRSNDFCPFKLSLVDSTIAFFLTVTTRISKVA